MQVHGNRLNTTQGWRTIDGRKIFFRSKWEANFSRYLQWQKEQRQIKEWKHEPKTFWFDAIKRGVRSYKPDFYVEAINESYWIEVKGYYDAKSLTKIKRFAKYFPEEKLKLFDANWFKNNNSKLRLLIKNWE